MLHAACFKYVDGSSFTGMDRTITKIILRDSEPMSKYSGTDGVKPRLDIKTSTEVLIICYEYGTQSNTQ